jgi:hypothetical protein
MQFCVYTLNDHDLRPFQHTSEKIPKKFSFYFIQKLFTSKKRMIIFLLLVLSFRIWTDFEYFTEF